MTAAVSNDYQRKAHFTFIWTIENASALFVSCVESPAFTVQSMEKTKWKLNANCYGGFQLDSIALGIRKLEDNGPDSIEIEIELSVLAADGSPLGMLMSKKQFAGTDIYWLPELTAIDEILSLRAELLPNDTLTVRCRMWRTGSEISKEDTCFARTRMSVDRRSCVWAIREFSKIPPDQKRTHILNPTSHGSPKLILNLFLCERDRKTYVNIQIDQNSAGTHHYIFCKLSLLDSDGKVVYSEELGEYIKVGSRKKDCSFFEFLEKDKLESDKSPLLPNDVLTLRCEFQIQTDPVWSRIEHYRYSNLEDLEPTIVEMPEMHHGRPDLSFTVCCPFKKAFEDLYGDESLSDVSLRAGSKSFPAHKNVLSVRSPVFEAMFTRDMREKTSNIVDIPDLNAETLNRLLLYIYKNTVQELQWESAMDLFRAADKYQLLDLGKKCSFSLKSNLSLTNVCSILSLADMHEDGDLRKTAVDFISEHDDEVFNSNEWKNFKMENFQLASEVIERIPLIKIKNLLS
ncbi:Speckle-type POZ protein [Araneus ventricosus]|uniref:Speckle-type POZ protein n=1 Tax=Araneus ventricosus TaxID=182803 RepID=A0A4Y2V7E1_ARAVE|nr:Speckle-type POZ protein [Araneus ventricosus]